MINYDSFEFRKFTKKSELDKVLHTLEGILRGISIDSDINVKELDELKNWCRQYSYYQEIHPFNELVPKLWSALEDNVLTDEEIEDILWLCNNLRTKNKFYDVITSGIQKLQGILHGVLADNEISDTEIIYLKNWLNEHEYLSGYYPYDEIYSMLTSILSDGVVTDDERNILKVFFAEFIDLNSSANLSEEEIKSLKEEFTVEGICSLCPEITFDTKTFCFTGASSKTTRSGLKNIIESLHGKFTNSVSSKTDYLIIGGDGNPCWAYSCYGRKVEDAINLRKKGKKVIIVHENDFWDTIEDLA